MQLFRDFLVVLRILYRRNGLGYPVGSQPFHCRRIKRAVVVYDLRYELGIVGDVVAVFVPRLVAGIIRVPRLGQIKVFRLAVVAEELPPILRDVRALELVDVNRIERLPHYVRRGFAPYEIPQKRMHLVG